MSGYSIIELLKLAHTGGEFELSRLCETEIFRKELDRNVTKIFHIVTRERKRRLMEFVR